MLEIRKIREIKKEGFVLFQQFRINKYLVDVEFNSENGSFQKLYAFGIPTEGYYPNIYTDLINHKLIIQTITSRTFEIKDYEIFLKHQQEAVEVAKFLQGKYFN